MAELQNCFVWTAHPGPGPQEKRFAAYLEGLARAAGYRYQQQPLKDYRRGLLLPGERKSIEPRAARQSIQHLLRTAPWSDEAVLATVQRRCCRQ